MEENFDYRSIKTFEDACKHLGLDFYKILQKYQFCPDHIQDLIKLEIITRALNDGWRDPLDESCYRYGLYGATLTDADVKCGRYDEFVQIRYIRPDGSAGLGCAYSIYGWSHSHSSFGSRLAYKSKELAEYSLKTFTEYWESYWFPQCWHKEVLKPESEW